MSVDSNKLTNANTDLKIVVSNGSYKFHLAPLAAELDKVGILAGFITAGWPSGWMRWLAMKFPKSRPWQRLMDRKEDISQKRVFAFSESELLFKVGDVVLRRISQPWQQRFHRLGCWWYIKRAQRVIRSLKPHIYHFRNCYGKNSIETSTSVGSVNLCDHSIAHPLCLQTMATDRGRYPTDTEMSNSRGSLLHKAMKADLDQADFTLVNSDFVKSTCIHAGMEASTIFVVYLGIDDRFAATIPPFDHAQVASRSNLSLLFAGGWQRRKGVDTLTEALKLVDAKWELDVLAGVEPELTNLASTINFFALPNVRHIGIIPRGELASAMTKSRIFVFPSFCEGSARVIFEAMACGCFIITTPNSGSIVEEGVHGKLVTPGNAQELATAIRWALENPDLISKIGWSNAQIIRSRYRQADYADRVLEVYNKILSRNEEKRR